MKRILIVGYLFVSISVVFAQAQSQQAVQNQYRFKHLSIDQGLSNNGVTSVCQDSKGFIWIATLNGVDKFNGQTIVTYRHDPKDSTSVFSNYVRTVYLDSKDNLWVASSAGLNLYNPDFDNFIRFTHKDIKWPIGFVESVVEDKESKLWISTETGLYSYDLNTSEIQYFSNKEGNPHGLPSNQLTKLLVDKNNNLWFSIMNEGLCLYKQNEGTFKYFKNNPEDPSTLSGNRIESLYEDSKGNIWAGTFNDGLNLYVPGNNSFIRTIPDPDNSYSTRVRAIFEDLKGNFFVGTRGGLYIRNDYTNKFDLYANEGHNFSNLSQNSIICSFIDKTGTLWIGTFSGGVNYTDLNKKEFIHYKAGKDDNHFLTGSNVYAVTEDTKGNIWVGGDNGLNYLDRTSYTFTYYSNDPDDPNSLSYNDIKSLEWDQEGNLWIGTNNGGLNYYDIETGKFKSYRHNPADPNSIAGNRIYGLLNDIDDKLWIISSVGTGNELNIDILQKGSDKFIHLNEKAYYGFDQDEKGNVLIGGVNGFWIFTRKDSVFNFVANDSLIGNVNTVRIDSKNRIWVGSNKGLVRYDPGDKSFVRFSEDNGYPINEVYGILEDDVKSLWISTNFGLIKITNIIEDINNIEFRVFDSDDGLQSKQFNYNAYYKSKTGEMIFGGINGFNTFYPNEIADNPVPPNVVITDLKIFNTSTPIGEKVRGRIVLKKSISVTDRINLGRKQNVFTLEFAALHYANPEKNTFKYKLEGFDEDWQYRKAGTNFATYSNLPAGEYTFIVTAANNDGVWNEEPVKLQIKVIPPFWKTWWFYLLVIVAIAFGSWKLLKMREKALKADKDRLENELNKGKAEIENQKDEILKQQEAIRLKEEQEANTKWHNEGIAKFSDIISSNKENVEKLSQEVLSNLVSYLGADQGGIFLINDDNHNEEEKLLELVASYSYSEEKSVKKAFMPGEGLIGTCFKECKITNIDNLPPDYTRVESGLGKSSPKFLVLVPIRLGEYVIGVLELASFHKIEDHKVEFIEKVTENLTSVVSIVRGSEQALQAVQIANEQKEEMLAQEEEIRQNMEEMQATQDELLRKQEEFANETAMLETLLNFLQDRITFKDPNGIYLRINKMKSDALKLKDSKDAIGLSDADFFGEEHFKKALIDERELIKSGKPILNNEEQIKFKDGKVQWGSTSRIPFKNSRDEMVGTLIITKNISDQKLVSGKLNSMSALLQELTSKHPLICYEADHIGTISQIYGHGLDLLGLNTEDLEESNIFSVFTELKNELDIENLKDQLNVEYELKDKKNTFNVFHKIVKNTSTGGVMGCAEVSKLT